MNDARRLAALAAATLASLAAVLSGLALMQSGGVGDCGADCAAALSSPWSMIPFGANLQTQFAVPVALVGMMYFSGLAGWLFLVASQPQFSRSQYQTTWGLSLVGALISLGYLVLMISQGQWCPLCVAAHLANFALLPFLRLAVPADESTVEQSSGWQGLAAVAAMIAVGELALWFGWDAARLRGEHRELMSQLTRLTANSAVAVKPQTFAPEVAANVPDREPIKLVSAAEEPAVTVEIFTDLLCLGCRFYERTFLEDYAPQFEGRINVVLRHFPLCQDCNPDMQNLHPQACMTSYLVEAAQMQGGEEAVKRVLHEIDPQRKRPFDDADVRKLAQTCDLDADRLLEDLKSDTVRNRVKHDVELGRSLGINSTPVVRLNGQILTKELRQEASFWQQLAVKQKAETKIAASSGNQTTVSRPSTTVQQPKPAAPTAASQEENPRKIAIAQQMLSENDANQDGVLDLTEAAKLYQDPKFFDKDSDGKITLAEITGGIGSIQGDEPNTATENKSKPEQVEPRNSTIFIGDKLEIKGQAISGQEFDLAELKGKPVLVTFWATWCPYCVKETADLLRLYQTYHDKGLEIVGISSDARPEVVQEFVEKNGVPWPQLCSTDPEAYGTRSPLVSKHNVMAFPSLFLVGADGLVKEVHLRGHDIEVAVARELGVEPVAAAAAEEIAESIRANLTPPNKYEPMPPYKEGDRITIAGPTIDGKHFDSNEHRGKAMIVAFWASWCPHCMNEIPVLESLHARYKEKGLEIVGISLDRTSADLETFLAGKPLPWPTIYRDHDGLRDFNNPLARRFRVTGIPVIMVLDQEGRISALKARGPTLEKAVADLLGEVPPAEVTETTAPKTETTEPVKPEPKTPVTVAPQVNKPITDPKMALRLGEIMFKQIDANQDGALDAAELEKAKKTYLTAYDVDKNEKISLEELTAAIIVSGQQKAAEDKKAALPKK